MALRDVFRRHGSDSSDGPGGARTERAPDSDDEPGSVSSQDDVEGRGPVTLADRTGSGQGSPDTNQAKTEPTMPATPGHPDPSAALAPPALGDMNVGAGDAQLPSHPLARPRDVAPAVVHDAVVDPGVAPADDRPALDTGSSTKLPEGPEMPAQATEGTAQRQPGSQGSSPEQQETDVDTGAAHMQPSAHLGTAPADEPGDSQDVPVPHEVPMPGTSEEQGIVQGARSALPPPQ